MRIAVIRIKYDSRCSRSQVYRLSDVSLFLSFLRPCKFPHFSILYPLPSKNKTTQTTLHRNVYDYFSIIAFRDITSIKTFFER